MKIQSKIYPAYYICIFCIFFPLHIGSFRYKIMYIFISDISNFFKFSTITSVDVDCRFSRHRNFNYLFVQFF